MHMGLDDLLMKALIENRRLHESGQAFIVHGLLDYNIT